MNTTAMPSATLFTRTGHTILWHAAVTNPAVVLGLVTILLHVLGNGGYGFFRDELYFIVCGDRADWGYVDQPPLIPLIAAAAHSVFGDWLTGFRLVPGFAAAATVAMAVAFTRLIGGGRAAQWLAGICVMCSPVLMVMGVILYTDMLLPLVWLTMSWCLVRCARSGDERWWLGFWAAVAVGFWSKYLIVFYAGAVVAAMLATPLRRSLLLPWFYAGAALVALLVAPNIWWQYSHGWPFLEVGSVLEHSKNRVLTPPYFFAQQILVMGPLAAPVWMAGLFKFAARPTHAADRIFAIAYVLLAAAFILGHGKVNYLAAIYPVLFAGGAVLLEETLYARALRIVLTAAVALEGAVFVPMAMPILPEDAAIRYQAAFGIGPSLTAVENHPVGRMSQHFGDMHGWPELAAKVAAIYRALPPDERRRAVFLGRNYGDAAAIDIYGRRLGLPPAISAHNNYYLWGPRGHDGNVVITLGGDPEWYATMFRSIQVAGHTDNLYAQPSEIQPIYVLRGAKAPLSVLWPKLKRYG